MIQMVTTFPWIRELSIALASFIILLLAGLCRSSRQCPCCGAELARIRMPKNIRQFLWGYQTCLKCGCEIDAKGQKAK